MTSKGKQRLLICQYELNVCRLRLLFSILAITRCDEGDSCAPLTPVPEMLRCSTSHCHIICPAWYQIIQNCKTKASSKLCTLGTQYGQNDVSVDQKRILIQEPCSCLTFRLLSTHYCICVSMATFDLARYIEIIVLLHRPPPLQGDISGMNGRSPQSLWSKHAY